MILTPTNESAMEHIRGKDDCETYFGILWYVKMRLWMEWCRRRPLLLMVMVADGLAGWRAPATHDSLVLAGIRINESEVTSVRERTRNSIRNIDGGNRTNLQFVYCVVNRYL